YVDVLMEKYNKGMNPSTISTCTFTCDGSLNDPVYNDLKKAAFELNDVATFTIGEAVNGRDNVIENSLFGIYSKNSSFTLLNTEFNAIWDNANPHVSGNCVKSLSNFDINNRQIEIGNGTPEGANFFSNSMIGLLGAGEMNYTIKRNSFGTGNPVDCLREFCISIENNGRKEIVIQSQNEFYDYRHGIDIAAPGGTLKILNNTFENANFSSTGNFEGTAINAYGIYPMRLPGSEISNNTIGASTGAVQSRIGIRISMIDNVNIATNTIYFHQGSIPTDPYAGIWVENCNETKIVDINEVENISGLSAGSNNMLTGLKLDQSSLSCIEQNIFSELGFSMDVSGTSIISSLYQNQFYEFDAGIHFSLADIGPKVGTQSSSNPNDGNVMGNLWTCTSCGLTTNNRITGNYGGQGLLWYTPTNTTGDPEFPDNSVAGGLLTPFPLLGTTSDDSECPLPSIPLEEEGGLTISLSTRNETFGSIVADTGRYPEEYQNEFRYINRQLAFGVLKRHPELIEMDDDSDTSFVNFYNGTLESNINTLDSLENLIANSLFVAGDTLLNHFTDTNHIEYNYKRVYRLYIKARLYGDTSLTDSEWDELYAIANEHPLTGGKAVFVARNFLKLEIHNEELSSSRIMYNNKQGVNKKLVIYPNPANNYVQIKVPGAEEANNVLVSDFTGRVIVNLTGAEIINTTLFAQGLYLVRVLSEGERYFGSFVITR
ncbi:MAG: T9SS type A sorting domain-containing protein, partial [Bacteroidia bacterium]|nr:T9SS type A sorting domain-containing protein [Bacteroidia bacterium]